MKRGEPNRKANIWVARIIPVVLLGIIGYASWILTKRVCVDYLINPDPSTLVKPRLGAAIAILVIYYHLLIALLICYARLIYTITVNPGFLPRGPGWIAQKEQGKNSSSRHHSRRRRHRAKGLNEKDSVSDSSQEVQHPSDNPGVGVEDFWQKDVFVCLYDGRPNWCSTCMNWKTDRAHHCSEVNRCVRKMDHFCPWVGGIISETSIKFFLQFLFYTMLFTTNALIVMAVFFAERTHKTSFLDVHWILALALAALFFFFSLGMFASSGQLALINCSTIENFSRHSKTWYIAVYLPRPEATIAKVQAAGKPPLRTITYPRPPDELALFSDDRFHRVVDPSSGSPTLPPPTSIPSQTPAFPSLPPSNKIPPRTFAILELPRGANPWSIDPLTNWREVMGYSTLEWFLPVKYSPCASHNHPESMYRLGSAVGDARRAAGIEDGVIEREEKRRRRRRRRMRRMVEEG